MGFRNREHYRASRSMPVFTFSIHCEIVHQTIWTTSKGKVRKTYSATSDRVSRATGALRGEEESQLVGRAVALAVGVGLGIGTGVLIATASGEGTLVIRRRLHSSPPPTTRMIQQTLCPDIAVTAIP